MEKKEARQGPGIAGRALLLGGLKASDCLRKGYEPSPCSGGGSQGRRLGEAAHKENTAQILTTGVCVVPVDAEVKQTREGLWGSSWSYGKQRRKQTAE